jgi:hypothetical protein
MGLFQSHGGCGRRDGAALARGGLIDLKAVAIGGVILGLSLLDVTLNNGDVLVFLLKKLIDLMTYIQFWHH